MVRAKFKVTSKTLAESGISIVLAPVTHGSMENQAFFNYTPWGKMELGTINEEAAKQFEVGKEYYLDFTPAGKETI